jgi:hypothetical protein
MVLPTKFHITSLAMVSRLKTSVEMANLLPVKDKGILRGLSCVNKFVIIKGLLLSETFVAQVTRKSFGCMPCLAMLEQDMALFERRIAVFALVQSISMKFLMRLAQIPVEIK